MSRAHRRPHRQRRRPGGGPEPGQARAGAPGHDRALEAIAAGTARLVGTDEEQVVAGVMSLLRDRTAYRAMAKAVNPYGDGTRRSRSVDALERFFRSRRAFPESAFSCAVPGVGDAIA